jgi:hypothetical protein
MTCLLILFLQAPAIEEVRSVETDAANCSLLKASQTGKYVMLGRPETIEVYTATDLKLAKRFELPWTAVGFDEEDEHLLIVGKELLRYRPKDWAQTSRHTLEDSEFLEIRTGLRPRQAWMYPDGSVLYRSKRGGVRHADWDAGKLVSKLIISSDREPDYPIEGIIGMSQAMILDLGAKAGVLLKNKVYFLPLSHQTLFAESVGGVTVLVGRDIETTYNPDTWRIIAARGPDVMESGVPHAYLENSSEGERYAAAIDHKSGWVIVAGEQGLRAWNSQKLKETQRYPVIQGSCLQLAIDNSQRRLYTVEAAKLRCWKIKE